MAPLMLNVEFLWAIGWIFFRFVLLPDTTFARYFDGNVGWLMPL
jgi:hypothetical protein